MSCFWLPVWALAAIGMVLDLIGRPLRRGQATAFYLAMRWAVLPVAPALRVHPRLGTWLLIGGILYTSGAIAYWRQRPRRRLGPIGFHELRFEAALGASAQFWLNAQTAWDLWHRMHSPAAKEIRRIRRFNAA